MTWNLTNRYGNEKKLYFRGLPILFDKCTTFYLIMTSDVRITLDLSIELRQVLMLPDQ